MEYDDKNSRENNLHNQSQRDSQVNLMIYKSRSLAFLNKMRRFCIHYDL